MLASRLTIGTAQFGLPYGVANNAGKVGRTEVEQILELARSAGVGTLDTAIAYGNSEEVLGEIGVDEFAVISKLPEVPEHAEHAREWIRANIDNSLKRLKIPVLAGALLHRPMQLLGPQGSSIYSGLRELKDTGKVNRIGISIYDISELEELIPRFGFDIVQLPLNIWDGRITKTKWIEQLVSSGVAVHVRSIFLQGLLLMNLENRPTWFSRWRVLWERWDAWLKRNHTSALEACIRYAFSLRCVERVVVGVDSMRQLNEILAALDGELPRGYEKFQMDDSDLLNPAHWRLQ